MLGMAAQLMAQAQQPVMDRQMLFIQQEMAQTVRSVIQPIL